MKKIYRDKIESLEKEVVGLRLVIHKICEHKFRKFSPECMDNECITGTHSYKKCQVCGYKVCTKIGLNK